MMINLLSINKIKLLIENIKNDDKFIKYKQENTFEILEQLENK